MTTALIDADIVAYRASAAAQEDWDGETMVDLDYAIREAEALTVGWTQRAGCSDPLLCFTAPDNFRKSFDGADYKAGRGEKPRAYWDVVAHLETRFQFLRWPRLEADDVMAILGTGHMKSAVVVTIDKDLKTAPIRLFNPVRDIRPQYIRPFQADLFWMKQTLMGDPTDGYKGCPKIGPKRADAILESCISLEQMWEAVVKNYEAAELSENEAILNARMARILRHEDYNQETQEYRLWHPTNPIWVPLSHIKSEEPTTSAEKSSQSNTSSPTGSVSVRATSSSTSPAGPIKGGSKTSRKRVSTSTS